MVSEDNKGILFDGTDIIKRPRLDLDAYNKWRRQMLDELPDLERAEEKTASEAMREWMEQIPAVYKGASVEAVESYDPTAAAEIREYVAHCSDNNEPCKNAMIYSNHEIRGKTWAMYATLHEMVRCGLMTDPVNEIRVITEAKMISELFDFGTQKKTLAWLTSSEVKVIAVDAIGLVEQSNRVMNKAWGLLKDRLVGRQVRFICVAACPLGPDQKLRMTNVINVLRDNSIINGIAKIKLSSQPSDID